MIFEDTYKKAAPKIAAVQPFEGKSLIGWRSPSNIALIKYWGKRDVQLPENPSLSFALSESNTETTVQYQYTNSKDPSVTFTFEGKENKAFEKRIVSYLSSITAYLPFLRFLDLAIESRNSFPHSSGIASSASSMSALALCLVSIEDDLFGTLKDEKSFFEKASFLARLGSGSAARSVYGNYSIWGGHSLVKKSKDEVAIPVGINIHPSFYHLQDAILITSSASKKVSSSKGHKLMVGHDYADIRYEQARKNLTHLVSSLGSGDEGEFIRITENEALSLHALMMNSAEGFTLLNQSTWNIIEWIRRYRNENNVFLTFTLDAGPNVHMIYKQSDKAKIEKAIRTELVRFCEQGKWINDQMGNGPERLT